MKRIVQAIRRFYSSLGLVEQSQVVASTAVVVAMMTIISAHFFTGESLQWLDFIGIITVGIIGFVSVYFSLKYGRQLEEQRRELIALSAFAEAVNHSVELEYLLQSVVQKVAELLGADFGWLYLVENNVLILKHRYGTTQMFLLLQSESPESLQNVQKPFTKPAVGETRGGAVVEPLDHEGLQSWASIPLERKGQFAGVLIIGSRNAGQFTEKGLNLLRAFGNQINMALHNASLFEQVRQSEQRYADLYEHSPDMYHSVNKDGLVVGCNITESVVLGYAKEDIVGKPLVKLYPAPYEPSVRENLRRLFSLGEELRDVEEQVRKKDGTLIDVSVNTSLVYNVEGRPVLARIVARDITEKKKLEAQILHSQKIDSIGNLAGGIAHDFNNILASILGAASMMKRKLKASHAWFPFVDLMESASRRGAALTRQLLTFARKSSAFVRPLGMNAVVRETLRLFEASVPKAIQVNTEMTDDWVVVNGDEGQLQQALLNLCINARDAMPEGGNLTIRTEAITLTAVEAARTAEAKPGSYVVLSVQDTGVGIPPGIQSKVFEPFFTTKQPEKGTGLGLSVVYGVVRSHGGFITLDSTVGVGTKIALYFPRISETALLKKGTGPQKVPRGGEHILLVDDETSVGSVSSAMLADLGYSVQTVLDGFQAIDEVKNRLNHYSLVILDMNMPRIGGRDTFWKLKELSPELRILVCSGYSSGMLGDDAFLGAIDGFIQKPFTIQELAHAVREVLDRNGLPPG